MIRMSALDIHILESGTDLGGLVAHVLRGDFGGEEDLFAWDARGTDRISTGLLIAICPSGVNVAVASAEGVQSHRLRDISGSVKHGLAPNSRSYKQKMAVGSQGLEPEDYLKGSRTHVW
jgi:hypothetical protein